MNKYNDEQVELEGELNRLESAVKVPPGKADISRFMALVKKYQNITEISDDILYEFIERIDVHAAKGGRGQYRNQQIDIIFNFIGDFIPPLLPQMMEEEAERLEDERKQRKLEAARRSSKNRTKRRAEIKKKALLGDPEAMKAYEQILEKGREKNRKAAAKKKALFEVDPEYMRKKEEKGRIKALKKHKSCTQAA